MRGLKIASCFLAAVFTCGAALTGPVRTESGLVSGTAGADGSITAFKGIPFAAAPSSDLRWRAPQPPPHWNGVRSADRFGANCMQSIVEERKPWTHEFMAHGETSEDCLFLNIWTPAASPRESHPVLVYLHGGGNTEGSGSVAVYDGEGLARKGVVMVTVNYRLGILGFLAHPDLTKESEHHVSGNYALLDQIAALRWIQKNIAAFGGDARRVTVAGQSAGASDAQLLMVSPLAKGLFQRAILESGGAAYAGSRGGKTLAAAEEEGAKFAESKGAHSITDLRAMAWKDLSGARFGPVIDGYVVPLPPAEAYARGAQNDVAVIAGWNRDESGATPRSDTVTESDAARDSQRVSLVLWAEARSARAKSETYLYFYDHVLPGPDAGRYGAFHTSEVPYALNTISKSDRPFTDEDRRVADTVSSYWANFAATGNPNGKGLPHWPSARQAPGKVMEIGEKDKPIPAAGDDAGFARVKALVTAPRSNR